MYREIERDSKRPLSLTRCRTLNRVDTLTRLECHQSVADAKLENDDAAGNGDAENGVLIVEENENRAVRIGWCWSPRLQCSCRHQ